MKQEQDEKQRIVTKLTTKKNAITIVLQMGECMNEWTNFNVTV
jgi:hypothetical protein